MTFNSPNTDCAVDPVDNEKSFTDPIKCFGWHLNNIIQL